MPVLLVVLVLYKVVVNNQVLQTVLHKVLILPWEGSISSGEVKEAHGGVEVDFKDDGHESHRLGIECVRWTRC